MRTQGGHAARRLRLLVHTFEVRECAPHPHAVLSPLPGSITRTLMGERAGGALVGLMGGAARARRMRGAPILSYR